MSDAGEQDVASDAPDVQAAAVLEKRFTLPELRALMLRYSALAETSAALREADRGDALDRAAAFAATARYLDMIICDPALYDAFLAAGRRRFAA